jgi:hypothetical protein
MEKTIHEPLVYRAEEFRKIFLISKSSFYREVAAQRLQIIKRGRWTFVAKTEAQRWFASLPRSPAGRPCLPRDTGMLPA